MPLADYNSAPPNFKEITQKELVQSSFFIWEPWKYETRQIIKTECDRFGVESKYPLSIRMFHYLDGTGVALSGDWHAGTLRFFKFAECVHVFDSGRKLGNCYYEYVCGKCGYKNRVDSSD